MILPIFPLQLIVFPGEQLNLHIFEAKYRDLFTDLQNNVELLFGIPPVINNQIHLLGTRLKLINIVKKYDTGEMDVVTEGIDVFSIHQIQEYYFDKTYAGASVEIIKDENRFDQLKFEKLNDYYEEFQAMLTQRKEINDIRPEIFSFQIAHYSGLNESQKIALLATPEEEERQEIMIAHFEKVMPTLQGIQETQRRIVANGHFKNLQSFKFQKPD